MEKVHIPGFSLTAPIRRSTPSASIRKIFQFIIIMQITTLFQFSSEIQLNTQGAVTENPGRLNGVYTETTAYVYMQ